jgi:aminopeptidase N
MACAIHPRHKSTTASHTKTTMKTDTAPTIRLKDYARPAYLVDHVELDFALAPNSTRIVARLSMRRSESIEPGTPLWLDGDDLELVSLTVNDQVVEKPMVTALGLQLTDVPEAETFKLEIVTQIDPEANTQLSGLYRSSGVYCTQCEAEGFRRITFFPDRPDVLATYTVRVESGEEDCPVLLSNGNPQHVGTLPGGRHFAIWHDPWPKPSYLFALVAGRLDALTDAFTTASGKHVDLAIYVEPSKAPLARHAMDALKRSMAWDEQIYGREYDLNVFNIVAVSDFNMGAMENKGLNVFNDKYILASPELATDADYANIEAIVAHEYFHNWTGNRITCRDWFQLCLKEGLTVYRDQEYMADLRSRPVQRISQVRVLKAGQFTEDAGPLSHPVRPQSYKEINNFYTATVYQKGAELVRMIAALTGLEGFRRATDLYFERHDGEAATVEQFIACFEETNGLDLTQFMRWYNNAGTPLLRVEETWNEVSGTFVLTFFQSVPDTPGQSDKPPMVIPIRFGLLGKDGTELGITPQEKLERDGLLVLREETARLTFQGLSERPLPSLLRGFSAPVRLEHEESTEARMVRANHDADLYTRFQALNGLALDVLADASRGEGDEAVRDQLVDGLAKTARDAGLESEFRAQALTLPSGHEIVRHMRQSADPVKVATARGDLLARLGKKLVDADIVASAENLLSASAEGPEGAGRRTLKAVLLTAMAAAGDPASNAFVERLYHDAINMTDRLAALNIILNHTDDAALAENVLTDFHARFADHPLVIDKWFAVQAVVGGNDALERVEQLVARDDFTLKNPNRARSLLSTFALANLDGFNREDGAAYEFYCKQLVAIDALNPQVSARMMTLMDTWTMLTPAHQVVAKAAISRLAETSSLSVDLREIIEKNLA